MLTPSSETNSHFARKALSATPGLAPGGLGTRQTLLESRDAPGTFLPIGGLSARDSYAELGAGF